MQPVGPGKGESVGGSPFPPWGPAVQVQTKPLTEMEPRAPLLEGLDRKALSGVMKRLFILTSVWLHLRMLHAEVHA